MKIYNNIAELIGNTPLVYLNRLNKDCVADVALKLESFNPLSSIKDRVALNMIEDGEKQGIINSQTTIIEPTSGNTGIGLAYICAIKNYRLILTMPETMSIERRKLLNFLGAEIILTKAELGMQGAIDKANQLNKSIDNSVIIGQFDNPSNPETHIKTTAKEIWDDTDGKIDILVAGVGTGGTLCGITKYIKSKKKDFKSVAIEPMNSAVLSGEKAGVHGLQGIGAGFIPQNCDTKLIDEIIKVTDEQAIETAKQLAKTEGILSGISGGAALYGALELAKKPENKSKLIVVILPDSAEKYLSTKLFD